jgi:hypothetical protein
MGKSRRFPIAGLFKEGNMDLYDKLIRAANQDGTRLDSRDAQLLLIIFEAAKKESDASTDENTRDRLREALG